MVDKLALETPLINALSLVMKKGANYHKQSTLWVVSNIVVNSEQCAKAIVAKEELMQSVLDSIISSDFNLSFNALYACSNLLLK